MIAQPLTTRRNNINPPIPQRVLSMWDAQLERGTRSRPYSGAGVAGLGLAGCGCGCDGTQCGGLSGLTETLGLPGMLAAGVGLYWLWSRANRRRTTRRTLERAISRR